jgi:hypothetical protein
MPNHVRRAIDQLRWTFKSNHLTFDEGMCVLASYYTWALRDQDRATQGRYVALLLEAVEMDRRQDEALSATH